MLGPGVPVCGVGEFFTAVAADVRRGAMGGRRVESGLNASQGGARPRVSAKVQRVLVSLGLVLVLESVRAVLALILLFHGVEAMCAIPLANVFWRERAEKAGFWGRGGGKNSWSNLTLAPLWCRTFSVS